jgi:hypothetical protein
MLIKMPKRRVAPVVLVESRILILRQQKILDKELAQLYGILVKRLNEQVKRNRERFPADFMFHVTAKEGQILRETHDSTIQGLIGAIKDLMLPPGAPRCKIGFQLPPAKRDSVVSRRPALTRSFRHAG